jgi:hypothetical protein
MSGMNDTSTSDASELVESSSSILAGGAEDPAASFIRPKDDDVLFGAEDDVCMYTSWPGAEDALSVGSFDGECGSAILVENDGTVSSAVSTSSLVISRLVAEKERLQTRVSVLEALAYSADDDLRASTTELPGRHAKRIQAMWRRALAMKQLRRSRRAAQAVQAWLRGRSARVAARRQGDAARRIQLAARWRQGARRRAARMIQRAARRFRLSLARQTKGALLRELVVLRREAAGLRQALDDAWGGASGEGSVGGMGPTTGSACQLRVDNERLQREKAEAEERASRLCAEGLLLRGRLEMLAAATAKAEETASLCVAARLQAEFDNEDSEPSCQGWAQ